MGYKIILGDCLDVLAGLGADSVSAIATDPPYCSGGRQQASARNVITKSDARLPDEWFIGDNMGVDTYVRWMRQIARESLRACSVGSQAFVFTDWRQYTNLVTAWESVGWSLRSCVVWDKNRAGAMGSFWRNNHEWVAVFTKGQPRKLPGGSFFNTWTGNKPRGGKHPTEKPVELMRYLLRSVTPRAGLVVDPFCGSGTTGQAAVMEGFDFVGIEREPEYAAISESRIAAAASGGSLFTQNKRKPA
jgi:site-specific DNA-methyltransferase (adenine-specific)